MENSIILAPEVIGNLGFLPVTNTMLVAWIVSLTLVILSFLATFRVKAVPTGLQNVFELVIEYTYNLTEEIAHSRAKTFFPWVMTFFFFIITANWLGLLPGFGTVIYKGVPLLRSVNSDLNITLALALTSAFMTHFFALRFLGVVDYLKKFFSPNPIFLFVGLLELVGEFTKIVSLSFRLFGNIFAGEVVLTTVAGIFAFVVPLPFYFLEIIVGFVQAAVFMMLTLVFMSILSEKHVEQH